MTAPNEAFHQQRSQESNCELLEETPLLGYPKGMVRAIALSCCCFQIVLVLNLTTCTTASYRYFILRHGETDHNAAGIIQGSSDVSRLNKRGQAQARAAGIALAQLDDVTISRVLCSPLARARQTLEILNEAAPLPTPTVVAALREIDLHSWEGRQKKELKALFPAAYAAWKADALSFTVDGHLPVVDLWRRAAASWTEDLRWEAVAARPSADAATASTLIVCHSACGQALLATARGLTDPRQFRVHEFPNCGCVEIEWPHDEPHATRWRWRLPALGEWQR